MNNLKFYNFLRTISPTELPDNNHVIRERITDFVANYLFEEDKSVNTYIMHLQSGRFIYISDHVSTQGMDIDRIYNEGQLYFNEFFYPEEIKIRIEQLEPQLFKIISSIPPDDLINWHFSFDFRMKYPNGEIKKYLQSFMVVADDTGMPFIIYSKVKDVTHYYFNEKMTFIATHETQQGPVKTTYEYFPTRSYCFSKREKEILRYIALGMSSQKIAETLFLSVNTIRNHRQNMLDKAGLKNTAQLINLAKELGELK